MVGGASAGPWVVNLPCTVSRSAGNWLKLPLLLPSSFRIGGFNFYWAWLSGRLAGLAAAEAAAAAG